jgi:hypothetical protein
MATDSRYTSILCQQLHMATRSLHTGSRNNGSITATANNAIATEKLRTSAHIRRSCACGGPGLKDHLTTTDDTVSRSGNEITARCKCRCVTAA